MCHLVSLMLIYDLEVESDHGKVSKCCKSTKKVKRASKTKSNPMGNKEKTTLGGAIPLNAKDKGSGHGRLVNPNPDCMSFNVSSHSLHSSSCYSVAAAKVLWHCSQPDWPNGSKTILSSVMKMKMKTPGITPDLQQVTPMLFCSQPQPHLVSTTPISFNLSRLL